MTSTNLHRYRAIVSACALAAFAVGASAQTSVDRSFTSHGAKDCKHIEWSDATLAKYPRIADACRDVMERDGMTFVKFQGTLMSNNNGKELVVKFKGANEMTLTPPPELKGVYVDNKKEPVPVAELKRGDDLTFYVAEDRLAARFYAENSTPTTTTEYVLVPIVYTEHVAQVAHEPVALPATASRWPLLGVGGLMITAFALALSLRRFTRRLEPGR